MPRKKKRKAVKKSPTLFYQRIIFVGVSVLLLFLVVKTVFPHTNILGDNIFLARGDDSISEVEDSSNDENEVESDSSSSGDSIIGSVSQDSSSDENEIENETEDEFEAPEIRTTSRIRIENENEEQVRLTENERVRVRTKDGFSTLDITSGGVKTKFENEDGRLILKVEQEDGEESELDDDSLSEIEDRLSDDDIKVATAGANKFLIRKGTSAALSSFPVSVDLATNTLFVITPAGARELTILPPQAVANMLAANVINRFDTEDLMDELNQDDVSSVSALFAISEKGNTTVYVVSGISDQNLLGFIPVGIKKKVEISTETGEIVNENSDVFNKLLDFFSI